MNQKFNEIKCLYGISIGIEKNQSSAEMFQELVDIIKINWRDSENISFRMNIEGNSYESENFIESHVKLIKNIESSGRIFGDIELFHARGREKELDRDRTGGR